ncbi:DNA alkylation repair protein [Cryptosporangium arvum]|uniref:Putative DNA alkylation repair enzyme n=1 Tax=Cryptosporangium arvum DSM 44712 TaxID=927661 RepID=A0A010YFP3_9ACTN|nr:DNA alkylation repair protein [Cryptosporangium arvum]EXG79050.1 putative DNA alkylation repair enzyme [Cryptosporangium arvum DSM 44712]
MNDLVAAVRAALAAAADPDRAPGMQAYMKSTMPYLGVAKPVRAEALKPVFVEHPLADRASWEKAVRTLWHEATYREERYAAIDLTGHRAYRQFQDATTLDLYRELVVGGAWWDYVDEIASRRVGPILRTDRAGVTPVIRTWSTDPDPWLRRTSIICQLSFKQDTDLELLTDAIAANAADQDFFLRKAIGWALRQYAWCDPEWVRAYVSAHESELSPLSRREARKNL